MAHPTPHHPGPDPSDYRLFLGSCKHVDPPEVAICIISYSIFFKKEIRRRSLEKNTFLNS
jgi:hypothetical protein